MNYQNKTNVLIRHCENIRILPKHSLKRSLVNHLHNFGLVYIPTLLTLRVMISETCALNVILATRSKSGSREVFAVISE